MRVPTTLSLALVGAALTLPAGATSYAAPAPTCLGEPATIVGTGPSLTGTPGADVIVTGDATSVDALGGDDLVCVTAPGDTVVTVLAGEGDDVVHSEGVPAADSQLQGGRGRDQLRIGVAEGYLVFNAFRGIVRTGAGEGWDPTEKQLQTWGFEGGHLYGEQLWIKGTSGPDDFFVDGCAVTVRGLPGADRLVHRPDPRPGGFAYGCDPTILFVGGRGADTLVGSRSATHSDILRGGRGRDVVRGREGDDIIRGGAGPDVLKGHAGDDLVIGGPGRDRAFGGRGRDTCRAERVRGCERR